MSETTLPSHDRVVILVIGDPHFKKTNIPECHELIKQVINVVKSKKPDFVVIMGDLLDTHNIIDVTPLNLLYKFIKELAALVETFILVGNHDMKNNKQFLTSEHSLNTFKDISNVHVCDFPLVYPFGNGVSALFCPYVFPGRFEEALAKVVPKVNDVFNWGNIGVIFAHQEFRGCSYGSSTSRSSTTGDVWYDDRPLVISGHIHERQKLSNIHYVGSALQHDFGDVSDKFLTLYGFCRAENSQDSNSAILRVKTSEIEEIPVAVKLRMSVTLSYEDSLKFQPSEKQKENHLRLIVECSNEDFSTFIRSRNGRKLEKMGVKIIHKPILSDQIRIIEELGLDSENDELTKLTSGSGGIKEILMTLLKKEDDEILIEEFNKMMDSSLSKKKVVIKE
jgi:DNA repair exonuclease SbcCD nuclease subunit